MNSIHNYYLPDKERMEKSVTRVSLSSEVKISIEVYYSSSYNSDLETYTSLKCTLIRITREP